MRAGKEGGVVRADRAAAAGAAEFEYGKARILRSGPFCIERRGGNRRGRYFTPVLAVIQSRTLETRV